MSRKPQEFTFTFTLTREAFGSLLFPGFGGSVLSSARVNSASIPRTYTPKTNAIIFYSNCNNPTAFGDFAQCGALAYEVQKHSGIPVVLTSDSGDIHRFKTLYGSGASYQLYGAPVQVISSAELNLNAFAVQGYVEVAWCKPNYRSYVNEIVGDATKCAFVGTANYQAPFMSPYNVYPHLFIKGLARNFLVGIDAIRDGVTFSSFDSFKKEVNADDFVMSVLPEKLIENARDYGLIYFSADGGDQDFLMNYLKLFTAIKQNALIVAIGDAESVSAAVKTYFHQATSNSKVILVDYDAKISLLYFKRGLEPKKLNGCYDVLPEQGGVTTIVTCRSVSNLQMRRLIAGAHQFVAMTGVSSTIEAWGEKKIVIYQWLMNNAEFIGSYYRNPAVCTSSRMLQDFGKLLLKSQLSKSDIVKLMEYLRNKPLCDQLAMLNERIIVESAGKLPTRLLEWFGIARRDVGVDLSARKSDLPVEAAVSSVKAA